MRLTHVVYAVLGSPAASATASTLPLLRNACDALRASTGHVTYVDQSIGCCECNTPWVPLEVINSPVADINVRHAVRFRGGAGSDDASDRSESGTSQDDSTVKIKVAAPTQESLDEIDALSRPSAVESGKEKGKPRR